ncbi:hypothetical protein LIA77_03004 [Sarocladium implicatum]|nr:hypothetical protein LIA77_03004 [Sarocladium implicatum]
MCATDDTLDCYENPRYTAAETLMAPFRPSSMAMRPQALSESKVLDGDRSEAIYLGPTPPTSPEQDIPKATAERKSPSSAVATGQAFAQATATMNPCAVAFTPAHSPPVTILKMSKGSRSSSSRSRNSVKSTEQEHVSVAQRSEAVILGSPRLQEDVAISEYCLRT